MGETRIEILVSDHIVVLFSACLPAFQPNLGKALSMVTGAGWEARAWRPASLSRASIMAGTA